MEFKQGEIIQKPKIQELSSLFIAHRLIVMYAPVKFHIFHEVWELWPGHESGTYGRSNRRGHKNARFVFLVHDTSAQCHACTCIVS